MSGACLMVRRAVLDQIQGFDEEYYLYGEDMDFCWRTKLAGWKVVFTRRRSRISAARAARARSGYATIEWHRAMWIFYRKHRAPNGRDARARARLFRHRAEDGAGGRRQRRCGARRLPARRSRNDVAVGAGRSAVDAVARSHQRTADGLRRRRGGAHRRHLSGAWWFHPRFLTTTRAPSSSRWWGEDRVHSAFRAGRLVREVRARAAVCEGCGARRTRGTCAPTGALPIRRVPRS